MSELAATDLWLPGHDYELNHEYPTATAAELQSRWQQYLPGHELMQLPGIDGAIRRPTEPPTAYASIDLCEVVRQTSAAIYSVEKPGPLTSHVHPYAEGLTFANALDVTTVAQTLIGNQLVPPTAGIHHIASLLQNWRRHGIYVFANTSTSPGCELGTIDFLERYLPGAFDGILFPRNHDGSLPLTKGIAAQQLLTAFGEHGKRPISAVHIDDLAHHTIGFRAAVQELPNVTAATFQPVYPSTPGADSGSTQVASPLEAFCAADSFLMSQLAESNVRLHTALASNLRCSYVCNNQGVLAMVQPEVSAPVPGEQPAAQAFPERYRQALAALAHKGYEEPTTDDLTRLREQLLTRPDNEPAELSRTRQDILDDPAKLRSFYQVMQRHDEALSSLQPLAEPAADTPPQS